MTIDPRTEPKKLVEDDSQRTVQTPTGVGQPSVRPVALITAPIVMQVHRTGSGKKKRKYSRGTKQVQRVSLGLSRSAYRVANSLASGFSTFSDRSESSADKRRDGMVRDSLRNFSRAFEDGTNQLGKAPNEIARKISGRTVTRVFRAFLP